MNGSLLDTNVLSELIRSRPEPRVMEWLSAQPEDSLFFSVITIGELRRGFELLADSKRREQLEQWFTSDLIPRFANRILPISRAIADRWGALDAACQLRGRPLNTADGLIAATALEHELTLVTRNTKDFLALSVTLRNPWD